MAAAPIKTWSPGESLLLGDLNNEIANIYAEINNISGANIIDGSVTPAKLTDGANPEVFFGEIFEDKIVTSGLTFVSDSGLTITLAPGTAYVLQDSTSPKKLVRVVKTLSTTISLSASVTQFIDLKSNGQFFVTTSTTVTTDASRIIEVVTDGSGVTANTDKAKRTFGDDFANTFGERKNVILTTTDTETIELEADFVVMSEDGTFQITHNAAVSADITVSGAGGLDQGSEATDAWYAVVLIADSTNVTNPTLLLVNETNWNADTEIIPAAYDQKRRIAWVRNVSGDFLLMTQVDDDVMYDDEHSISSSFSSASFTDIGTSTYTAPGSREASFNFDTGDGGGSSAGFTLHYTVAGITASSGGVKICHTRAGSETFDASRDAGKFSGVPLASSATRPVAFRSAGTISFIAVNGYKDSLAD